MLTWRIKGSVQPKKDRWDLLYRLLKEDDYHLVSNFIGMITLVLWNLFSAKGRSWHQTASLLFIINSPRFVLT